MASVTFVDNPNAPGAKMEMERLRAENAALRRRLDGGASSSYAEPEELTAQQLAEQPRTFQSGNCTITIVPLTHMAPLKMNPDFAGIVIRGQEEIAVSRVGVSKKKVAPQIAATSQTTQKSHAVEEDDEAAQRFALLELDR